MENTTIRWLQDLTASDVDLVGGKSASLGEMIRALRDRGIRVPGGFAITVQAYRAFLEANDLVGEIKARLDDLGAEKKTLRTTGKGIRRLISAGEFPGDMEAQIRGAYRELSRVHETDELSVAVRSSATAEDLPESSFAGQQETFLNVSGEEDVVDACRDCFASMFTDRAIAYRREQGFDDLDVALSVCVQRMIRADGAGAGVAFSIDPETGFPNTVVIDAAWGLGEVVVQGRVDPDAYRVFKPLLSAEDARPVIEKTLGHKLEKMVYAKSAGHTTRLVPTSKSERHRFVLEDDEILQLARWVRDIERHYGRPMDVEWAKDGDDGEIYIVQARPETVQSRKSASTFQSYELAERGDVLVRGLAIGQSIAAGPVQLARSVDDDFEDGGVLVTEMTDPDWVPVMQRAAAIVTDHGGRTSHAAIVSRELGIPAIVGTQNATDVLQPGQTVTVSCADGEDGEVCAGELEYRETAVSLDDLPDPPVPLMVNVATPSAAMRWWRLPVAGIGLARLEFIINDVVRAHPLALTRFSELEDASARAEIEALTRGFESKEAYFVDRVARSVATIAASRYPQPVVVRMSDFKSNEYARLVGGSQFEPDEENPMLGFRGASRYYSEHYRDGFELECRAIRMAREEIGLDNIIVMIPFVRTPEEADRVLEVLADAGLVRGREGLRVYMMCEVPSNVLLAEEFAERFDGFSIGSNDLTQLLLGVDRDSAGLAHLFDETNAAVRHAIEIVIERAHRVGCTVGICGQAPSDHPELASFLVECGIDSISLNPDRVIDVLRRLGGSEVVQEAESGLASTMS